MEQPACRRDGDDLLLRVRVTTRAAHEHIEMSDGQIRLRIKAAPVDGKANKAICKLLSQSFGVPASRIVIERGSTARLKTIRIAAPRLQPDWLPELPDC
jgi:hypothetical protein